MTRPSLPHHAAIAVLAILLIMRSAPARAQAASVDEASAAQGKKKKDHLVTFKWTSHPSLRVGKMLRIDFTARAQKEFHDSGAPTDASGTSSLDIAKRRLGVEGTVGAFLAFQVEHEIGRGQGWRDLYADVTRFTGVQLRGGLFKLPFSLDENTGATNLDFAYRSLVASQLAPGRDRGAMLHGQIGGRLFEYEAGVFEHDGRNASTSNPTRVTGGTTGAARLLVHPFGSTSRFEDLRIGIAATSSRIADGRSSLKGHTVLGSDMYQAEARVRGRRDRLGVELRWRTGPAAVRAEYIRLTEQRLGEGLDEEDLSPAVSQGWYVSGTWALTGETKSKGLDRPLHPLFRGGVGAVEVAARIEQIAYGSDPGAEGASTSPRATIVQGNRDIVLTMGVNWYPIRCLKIQGNVVREHLADPSVGPLPAHASFWSRVLQVQVGF